MSNDLGRANDLWRYSQAQRQIMDDPSLSIWGKGKMLSALDQAARYRPPKQPLITPQQLAHGAIGAGLGRTVGGAIGRFFGVQPDTLSTLKNLGMGLGTVLNTGVVGMPKEASAEPEDVWERDERAAFRLGFMKAAVERGMFEKSAVVAITPDVLYAPVKGMASLTRAGGQTAGAVGGGVMSDDPTDEEIARMEMERRMLKVREQQLRQQKSNRLVGRLLRRRVQAGY